MSTKKSVVKSTKAVETKVNEVSKINFDKFSKDVANLQITEKKKKERLYKYPESFTEKMINESEGKAFRSKQRNKIRTFANNIAVHYKFKKLDLLEKEVNDFVKYYKEVFRINDFTVNSISQKQDEKTGDIKLMLDIVKEFQK